MDRKYLIVFFLFLALGHLHAQQNVDQQAIEMLQRQDLFEIQEKYPAIASQIKEQHLKLMLDILLYANTNRIDLAHQSLESILTNHQQEIGFDNVSNFIALKAMLLGQEGYYKAAVDFTRDFLRQVTDVPDTAKFNIHRSIIAHYQPLYDHPTPSVVRPQCDVEVPFIRQMAGPSGALMRIPVQLNGKTYYFILDTGANVSYVHERFAREAGLRILDGEAPSLGTSMSGAVQGRWAAADSLTVGGISFRHPLFYVGSENEKIDTIYYVDAVLGSDFLHALAEMQIDNERSVVRFPLQPTPCPPTGPNMLYSDRCFRVKAYVGQERLLFHLDTGDALSSLNSRFYQVHRQQIDSVARNDSSDYASDNLTEYKRVKMLPAFALRLGQETVTLTDMTVYPEVEANAPADFNGRSGNLGQQFVTAFRCLIFNFKDGFLSGEPYPDATASDRIDDMNNK